VAALLDRIGSAGAPALWLDDTAYSERLMAGGRTNWLETAEYIAYRRKAAGLLRPDVTVLPVEFVAKAWIDAHPELKEAMGSKKRVIVPLRTLLADEDLRAKLVDLLKGLRAVFGGSPLALALPSPRKWIALAYSQAFGDGATAEFGADEVETAAVYVAEFLRSFSEANVSVVLLQEPADGAALSAGELSSYQPILNLAGHYRWDVGIHFPGPAAASLPGVAFTIAAQAIDGTPTGIITPAAFWADGAAPAMPAGGFKYAEIPKDAVPEKVLERLGVLRGA